MARRPTDPRTAAEAAFKSATTKPQARVQEPAAIPGTREQVTLRIDSSVLEFFQQDGPGWQDRINEALREIVARS